MPDKPLFEVMLSSTFRDLVEHRAHVSKVLKQQRLYAIEMEDKPTLSDEDMIDGSLAKVDAAAAYVCIIGKRYGQVRTCPIRNPSGLSLTELEFERALARSIPITVLQMGLDYPVSDKANEFDPDKRVKLQAFRDRAGLPHRVIGEFDSWDQFLNLVPPAIDELREALDKRASNNEAASNATVLPAQGADDVGPPVPPEFHTVKPFTQGHDFVGRKWELDRMTRWAREDDPILVFEAIGGMGKSMVTYRWIDKLAPAMPAKWEGRLWYSFYEEGASMNDFCVHALAYMEKRPPRDFRGRKTGDLEPLLLKHLHQKRWLIVMDGLERVLVAYDRFDKAQLHDDQAITEAKKSGSDPNRCVHPADDHLLQALATARSAKLLVSTRNMPTALLNQSLEPIVGVAHERLTGLEPEDAEQMMREAGVRGGSQQLREYLDKNFDCHPLMVGVVAGLINSYVPDPGNFDRWLADPQGAGTVDLSTLDGLARKRDHILKIAYESLEPDTRRLLGVLAFFSQSISGEVLSVLNPKLPPPPAKVKKPTPPDENGDYKTRLLRSRLHEAKRAKAKTTIEAEIADRRAHLNEQFVEATAAFHQYESALMQWRSSSAKLAADAWLAGATRDLQRRGLLIADRRTALYDLHPMVRGFVRHALQKDESASTGRLVADYAGSKSIPRYETAASLADLADGIQIVTALTLGAHYADAADALIGSLSDTLRRLEFYTDQLALLRPFFPQGWDEMPTNVDDEDTRGSLANDAAVTFSSLHDTQQAHAIFLMLISHGLRQKDFSHAARYIPNLCGNGSAILGLYRSSQLLKLSAEAADVMEDSPFKLNCLISRAWLEGERGDAAAARTIVADAASVMKSESLNRPIDKLDLLRLEIYLLQRERQLSETLLDEALDQAKSSGNRFRERALYEERGIFFQWKNQHGKAIEAFEKAVAMGRLAQVTVSDTEASYGLSLFALGRRAEAMEIAQRLAASRSIVASLAELQMALGLHDLARETALKCYRWAWGDGPPYAFYNHLKQAEGVLISLGEAPPQLAPFDPKKIEPFEFEAEFRHLLAEERRKKSTTK